MNSPRGRTPINIRSGSKHQKISFQKAKPFNRVNYYLTCVLLQLIRILQGMQLCAQWKLIPSLARSFHQWVLIGTIRCTRLDPSFKLHFRPSRFIYKKKSEVTNSVRGESIACYQNQLLCAVNKNWAILLNLPTQRSYLV